MAFPKISKLDTSRLKNLKSRFSRKKDGDYDDFDEYDDEYYDEESDEEYGSDYDDEHNDENYGDNDYDGEYDDGYNDRFGGDDRVSSYSREARYRRGRASNAPLVSFDDVKAHTQVPDRLMRDPLEEARNHSRSSRYDDYSGEQRGNSDGLNSLFDSPSNKEEASSLSDTTHLSQTYDGYDPYEAYSGSAEYGHVPSRRVTVCKPYSYGDVEQVAKSLRAGDAVVINLKNTNDQLAKRILDFSFGAASMVDARVDCIANKVFAISSGSALNDSEKMALRRQGVI